MRSAPRAITRETAAARAVFARAGRRRHRVYRERAGHQPDERGGVHWPGGGATDAGGRVPRDDDCSVPLPRRVDRRRTPEPRRTRAFNGVGEDRRRFANALDDALATVIVSVRDHHLAGILAANDLGRTPSPDSGAR